MNTKPKIAVSILALLLCSPAVFAGDASAGKAKSAACAACHGADGNSSAPDFPRLAGQHYDYLVKSITDYKTGARKDPIMAPMAANLGTQDIEDLAEYYSQQKGLVIKY
jgi:cytochrome c553